MQQNSPVMIAVAISRISTDKIEKLYLRHQEISEDIEACRDMYKRVLADIKESGENPANSRVLQDIVSKGLMLKEKLYEVGYPQPLSSLRDQGERTTAYIALMLNWMCANSNVGASLNDTQKMSLATEILESYGDLTMEETGAILRDGLRGRYGDFYRLDATVVHTWIARYREERNQRRTAYRYSVHQSTKEATRNKIDQLNTKGW